MPQRWGKSCYSGVRRLNQACPGTAVPIPDPVPEYGGMCITSFLKAFGKSLSQTWAGVHSAGSNTWIWGSGGLRYPTGAGCPAPGRARAEPRLLPGEPGRCGRLQSLPGCTTRRPAVCLWPLLKQLFPFSFRKKVVNWMKEFASNFGWWATTWGSYQIRWLSGSSGEKLHESRIKHSEALSNAGQGTWRAADLIQQSTCLTHKDLEHAKRPLMT